MVGVVCLKVRCEGGGWEERLGLRKAYIGACVKNTNDDCVSNSACSAAVPVVSSTNQNQMN